MECKDRLALKEPQEHKEQLVAKDQLVLKDQALKDRKEFKELLA